jgi:hypothetical protein
MVEAWCWLQGSYVVKDLGQIAEIFHHAKFVEKSQIRGRRLVVVNGYFTGVVLFLVYSSC